MAYMTEKHLQGETYLYAKFVCLTDRVGVFCRDFKDFVIVSQS